MRNPIASVLVGLLCLALSGPATAATGSASFGPSNPALLTVFSLMSWSNTADWTNWGSMGFPTNSTITGAMVSWNQLSTGGSGVHVALCNAAWQCTLVSNGVFSSF